MQHVPMTALQAGSEMRRTLHRVVRGTIFAKSEGQRWLLVGMSN